MNRICYGIAALLLTTTVCEAQQQPAPSPKEKALELAYQREAKAHIDDLAIAMDLAANVGTLDAKVRDLTKEIADLKAAAAKPSGEPKE